MKTTAQNIVSVLLFTSIVAFANYAHAVAVTDVSVNFEEVIGGPGVDFSFHSPSFGESDDTIFYMMENTSSNEDITVNLIEADGSVNVRTTQTISGAFESVYISFDPVGRENSDYEVVNGYIEFDRPIAAIIGRRPLLDSSDNFFAVNGVNYVSADFDFSDSATVNNNRLDISVFAKVGADRMRLLFEANEEGPNDVPEPLALGLMLLGLTTIAGLGRRKKAYSRT